MPTTNTADKTDSRQVSFMNYTEKLSYYLKSQALLCAAIILCIQAGAGFAYERNAMGVTATGGSEDQTELFKAAFNGKTQTVQELLDKGIDPNLQNDKGFTPLIVASQ